MNSSRGGSFRFGLMSDFYPPWGVASQGVQPWGGNRIWCKLKVVPIKGYYLGKNYYVGGCEEVAYSNFAVTFKASFTSTCSIFNINI
jgi:hypothetical protein